MKKRIFTILLFICFSNLNSQTIGDRDYEFLNEVLPSLLSIKNTDTIKMHENSIAFFEQEEVFTKDFFLSYTYPTLGVDSKKVKKLIKKLDLDYLAKQKKEISKWDFGKFRYPIVKFKKDSLDNVSAIRYQRTFGISRPIYSEHRKMAFVYYEYYCGILCGETGLKIYKKEKGKWCFYVQIPLSIS